MRTQVIGTALGFAVSAFLVGAVAFGQPTDAAGGQPTGTPGSAAAPGPGASGGASLSLTPTSAQVSTTPGADKKVEEQGASAKEEKEEKLPWRGTRFTFGQETTTQTVGIGADYQSRNPLYEIAFALEPRYYVLDRGDHTININARLSLSQELTNSDSTTREREVEFQNTTVNAAWSWTVYQNDDGWRTRINGGPRVVFPTAKTSWRSGLRLQLGLGVGAGQGFPLAGKDSTWFPSGDARVSMYYLKGIQTSQVGENADFERDVQGVDGLSLRSNQISATARASHQLTIALNGDVDVLESLHLGLGYTWIMRWAYTFGPVNVASTGVSGSSYPAQQLEDATNFRVVPWFMANLDYDLLPEVGLGIGYYNQTSAIGEDGRRRNSLWSPDARFFLDITANLDEIYLTAAGKREKKDTAKSNLAARRQARARTALTSMTF